MKQHVSSKTNLLILVFTLSLVSIAAQARDSLDALRTDLNALASDPVFETGEITGKVLFCNDQNLSQDILVQIPGLLFQANTDATGRFTLSYVPTGTYSLTFSKNGSVLNTEVGVAVAKRVSTDIGTKVFCPDLDNDGYLPPNDCDNANPVVYPGAPELCGDGSDNNCNGQTDESCPTCSDADNDTFYAQVGCGIVDCNDGNNTISPAAAEICDGVDNNCNGQIDEAGALNAHAYYPDNDQDGFGDNSQEQVTCTPPAGFISVGGDCNDSVASVNPAAEEFCGNGLDDDCDGVVDEVDTHGGCSAAVCSDQELAALQANCIDGSSLTSGCIASSNLSATCNQGVLGLAQCAISNTPDCFDPSLSFDEAMACIYYASSSPCRQELENVLGNYIPGECVPGATQTCGSSVGQCTQGQQTCSDYATWGSCNGGVLPSDEICDQVDNDCNGVVDNNCVACIDADGDGFYSTLECPFSNGVVDCDDSQAGVYPNALEVCGDGIDQDCNGADVLCDADGDGWDTGNDCNDTDASIYPSASDICGYGIDQDCDGRDLGCDLDGDGFDTTEDCNDADANINPSVSDICGDAIDQNCDGSDAACDADGDGFDTTEDCNDADASIYPFAREICGDGIDQDCDGIDDLCDADGDGYSTTNDCDDANASIHPGAIEYCGNSIDEDCNGVAERCDDDGDGYDDTIDCNDHDASSHPGAIEICSDGIDQDCNGIDDLCDMDGDGYDHTKDCNDNDARIHPGAVEVCGDAIDQDCDGIVELCDADGDGYHDQLDCNDTDASIHPGAAEVCGDGVDQDCNGLDELCDMDGDGWDTLNDCNDTDANIYPGAGEICGDGIDQNCFPLDDACPL